MPPQVASICYVGRKAAFPCMLVRHHLFEFRFEYRQIGPVGLVELAEYLREIVSTVCY